MNIKLTFVLLLFSISHFSALAQERKINFVDSIVGNIAGTPDCLLIRRNISEQYDSHKLDSVELHVKTAYYFKQKDYTTLSIRALESFK